MAPSKLPELIKPLCRDESDLKVIRGTLSTLLFSDPDTRVDFRLIESTEEKLIYAWTIDDGRFIAIIFLDADGTATIDKVVSKDRYYFKNK